MSKRQATLIDSFIYYRLLGNKTLLRFASNNIVSNKTVQKLQNLGYLNKAELYNIKSTTLSHSTYRNATSCLSLRHVAGDVNGFLVAPLAHCEARLK